MSEAITSYIGTMSPVFFIRQLIVLFAVFLLGYLVLICAGRGRMTVREILICYPVGLSVYAAVAFILVVAGLPFSAATVTSVCVLAALFCVYLAVKNGYGFTGGYGKKEIVAGIITLLCIIVISTSGLLPVSVMNDSLYYYSMYPKALVSQGYFGPNFNVFLTDVGQMSVMINTLPYMYGFSESFGIQAFLNIDTLLLFAYVVYDMAVKGNDRRRALTVSVVSSLVLVSSMPYLIMSGWMMANGYFMCFMFICVWKMSEWTREDGSGLPVTGLLFTVMAFMRMEGCIIGLVLIMCFSTLKIPGKQLFKYMLLPMMILSAAYDIRIFLLMHIEAPYTFLTPAKALIQMAAMAAVAAYILFIRDKLPEKYEGHMDKVIPAGLVLINAALCIYGSGRYMDNLKAFAGNLLHKSGWGLFPLMIVSIYILCVIASAGKKKKIGYTFWDMCLISYLLACIAVCFARGDALRESIGDSGNRVLLQVTMLAFYAAVDHLLLYTVPQGTVKTS